MVDVGRKSKVGKSKVDGRRGTVVGFWFVVDVGLGSKVGKSKVDGRRMAVGSI